MFISFQWIRVSNFRSMRCDPRRMEVHRLMQHKNGEIIVELLFIELNDFIMRHERGKQA